MNKLIHITSYLILFITVFIFLRCRNDNEMSQMENGYRIFKNEVAVKINGYDGSTMEPFISRDGIFLFFNNSGENGDDMNIHFCKKIDELTFEYLGELVGVNSKDLEGVANMDQSGSLYFTSLRSYPMNFESLYRGYFDENNVTNVESIDEKISRKQQGYVNFDSEVSKDGNTLIFATGRFDGNKFPEEADLHVAVKKNGVFEIASNSIELMNNLNTQLLEYAPSLSSDGLEIFFNRANINTFELTIWQSKRKSINIPFEEPIMINAIRGTQTEGASITDDGKTLYYHRKHSGKFKIFKVSRN